MDIMTRHIVKCLVIEQHPFTYYDKVQKRYRGVIYDVWVNIKARLPQYEFREDFLETLDYTGVIRDKIAVDYDLGIGAWSTIEERSGLCLFSRPIFMNKHILLYQKKSSGISSAIRIFNVFLPLITVLLLVSMMLGYLLSKTETTSVAKNGVRRTVASVFGNRGAIILDSDINLRSSFVMVLIIILSLFGLNYIQALITSMLFQDFSKDMVNKDNINTKKVLCPKGYSSGNIFEIHGADVTYKDTSISDIVDILKADDSVDGMVLEFFYGLQVSREYKLQIASTDFGMSENCFVANPSSVQVLRDIDDEIIRLSDSLQIAETCKNYFGESNMYLCIH